MHRATSRGPTATGALCRPSVDTGPALSVGGRGRDGGSPRSMLPRSGGSWRGHWVHVAPLLAFFCFRVESTEAVERSHWRRADQRYMREAPLACTFEQSITPPKNRPAQGETKQVDLSRPPLTLFWVSFCLWRAGRVCGFANLSVVSFDRLFDLVCFFCFVCEVSQAFRRLRTVVAAPQSRKPKLKLQGRRVAPPHRKSLLAPCWPRMLNASRCGHKSVHVATYSS